MYTLPTNFSQIKLLLAIATLSAATCASATASCDKLYAEHLNTDLHLSYTEFDQTEAKGFRALAELGCSKQAADLIEQYVVTTGAKQSSLLWHVAQMRAEQADYPEAIRYARKVIADSENFEKNALRWNDYVLAIIAFLEHDKAGLIAHREQIAAAKAMHFGNQLNLKLVDSLLRNFDRDYKYAVSQLE
jgi:hypothetical protein